MADQSANYRGILAMIGGCACFSANDAATKFAAAHLPVTEVVAIRAFFTLLFAFIIVALRRESAFLSRISDPALVLRAVIETFIGAIIIYCLSLMPLANVIAILLVQPFLLTVTGALLLGENVGARRWTAVTVGFLGMLLVMKPATGDFDQVSLLVLVAAVGAIARDLLTRRIAGDVPSTVVTLGTALIGVPIATAGALLEPWKMPDPLVLAVIIVSAAFLVVAFTLIVIAFRSAEVSAVSPFRYSVVAFAVFLGFILFGEVPDAASLVGIGLIVAAGLYMLHRETVLRQQGRGTA